MKRLVTVVTPAILAAGLVLFDLSDAHMSIADTSIPDGKMTTSQTEAGNSSASATITITMYSGDDG